MYFERLTSVTPCQEVFPSVYGVEPLLSTTEVEIREIRDLLDALEG